MLEDLLKAIPDLLLRVVDGTVLDLQVPRDFPIPVGEKGWPLGAVLPPELADLCREPASDERECRLEDAHGNPVHLGVRVIEDGSGGTLVLVRQVRPRTRSSTDRVKASLFESTPEGVLITNADRRVKAVNAAFTRMTGFTLADVVGRRPEDFLRSGRHDPAFYADLDGSLRRDGTWQGQIWNKDKAGVISPQWLAVIAERDAKGQVIHFIHTLTDLTGHEGVEDRLDYLTHYDALTGLPNRILVQDRLANSLAWAERTGSKVVVLCIDLDRFQDVNARLGQATGDRMLLAVAERLKGVARKTDTVARFGGDEFLLVAQDITHSDQARRLALRVLDALCQPFDVDGEDIDLTVSIGLSVYPDDGSDGETIVRNAVAAVGQARSEGGSAYSFHSIDMTVEAFERHRLETSLRTALDRSEFVLHYQPKIDMLTGEVQGTEALIRWRHPSKGLVAPNDFIPLAEETGLILPIGEWVLRSACEQTRLWQENGFPNLRIAVNLSVAQLWDDDVVTKVLRALEASGLDPSDLELEITETHIIEYPNRAAEILHELKATGISFSIDDFGTGYSSLSMLRTLPVDSLKIDKSFVDDIPVRSEDRAILGAIITMGHSLSMHVVAEGVETAAQLEILRTTRCDLLQGFYFSRPLPPAAMEEYLRSSKAALLAK